MQFSKMHGLGNDFVVVDGVTQNVFFTSETIQRLADRHRGIGFDQLMILNSTFIIAFSMPMEVKFLNAEMVPAVLLVL